MLIGLTLTAGHTHARGLAHGGLIAALADNARGRSCGVVLRNRGGPETGGLLTVSLSLDYLGMAKLGQGLQFDTRFKTLTAPKA